MSELRDAPQPSPENSENKFFTIENFDKLPTEWVVWAWENFLKRMAASTDDNDTGTAKILLKRDLVRAYQDQDKELPKTLQSNDLDRSAQEMRLFATGNFRPIDSYLYKKKLITRPVGYEQYILGEQALDNLTQQAELLNKEIGDLRLVAVDSVTDKKIDLKQFGQISAELDRLESEYQHIMRMTSNQYPAPAIHDEIEALKTRIVKLKTEMEK